MAADKQITLMEGTLTKTTHRIYNRTYKDRSRKRPADFTRERKMTFEEVMIFMLISLKCSTQSALRRFFIMLGKNVIMKQQSFAEARAKINVCAFVELFQITVENMLLHCEKTWHGYRVYANDGTKIALPSDKVLRDYYGALGKDGSAPTAQGSVLYDVLNDIVVDARIEPLSVDERTLAMAHIDECSRIDPGSKKLAIYDRGYASFELIEKLENSGFKYVMRVRSKFNRDIDAQTGADGFVRLKKGCKNIYVRVIKFKLDSGETETLITNITDKRLGGYAFKKLYFMRWPVETKYDIVKNKLQIENFSSRTVEGVQQDFFAAMFLTNIAACAAYDAQNLIDQGRADKDNKYQYKANLNELIGVLKDRLVAALCLNSPTKQAAAVTAIVYEIKEYVIPVRNDRRVPRKPPRKTDFYHNQKVNC
jgi:hypothetical protein